MIGFGPNEIINGRNKIEMRGISHPCNRKRIPSSVISVNWNLFLTLTVRKIDAKNVTKLNEIEFCDSVPRFV